MFGLGSSSSHFIPRTRSFPSELSDLPNSPAPSPLAMAWSFIRSLDPGFIPQSQNINLTPQTAPPMPAHQQVISGAELVGKIVAANASLPAEIEYALNGVNLACAVAPTLMSVVSRLQARSSSDVREENEETDASQRPGPIGSKQWLPWLAGIVAVSSLPRSGAAPIPPSMESEVDRQQIKIDTMEDFLKIGNSPDFPPDGNYIQTSDLFYCDQTYHLSNFFGTYNGNGFSINGLNMPMFNALEEATVKNVILNGINIDKINKPIIAWFIIEKSLVENIIISNARIHHYSINDISSGILFQNIENSRLSNITISNWFFSSRLENSALSLISAQSNNSIIHNFRVENCHFDLFGDNFNFFMGVSHQNHNTHISDVFFVKNQIVNSGVRANFSYCGNELDSSSDLQNVYVRYDTIFAGIKAFNIRFGFLGAVHGSVSNIHIANSDFHSHGFPRVVENRETGSIANVTLKNCYIMSENEYMKFKQLNEISLFLDQQNHTDFEYKELNFLDINGFSNIKGELLCEARKDILTEHCDVIIPPNKAMPLNEAPPCSKIHQTPVFQESLTTHSSETTQKNRLPQKKHDRQDIFSNGANTAMPTCAISTATLVGLTGLFFGGLWGWNKYKTWKKTGSELEVLSKPLIKPVESLVTSVEPLIADKPSEISKFNVIDSCEDLLEQLKTIKILTKKLNKRYVELKEYKCKIEERMKNLSQECGGDNIYSNLNDIKYSMSGKLDFIQDEMIKTQKNFLNNLLVLLSGSEDSFKKEQLTEMICSSDLFSSDENDKQEIPMILKLQAEFLCAIDKVIKLKRPYNHVCNALNFIDDVRRLPMIQRNELKSLMKSDFLISKEVFTSDNEIVVPLIFDQVKNDKINKKPSILKRVDISKPDGVSKQDRKIRFADTLEEKEQESNDSTTSGEETDLIELIEFTHCEDTEESLVSVNRKRQFYFFNDGYYNFSDQNIRRLLISFHSNRLLQDLLQTYGADFLEPCSS